MKKRTLRPINKNALKSTALIVATAGLMGYQAHVHFQNKISKEEKINAFKESLVQYETTVAENEPDLIQNKSDSETVTISDKVPRIAIIYHTDGNISLVINRAYLSLEAAMEEYPALTANIKKYIEATNQQNVQNETLEK